MGKIRKPRRKDKPSAPIEDKEEVELLVDSKENAVQTIIDQLQAANVEEKYCGLQTFALLTENVDNVSELLDKEVVKMVAPLLIDPASCVRNGAAGSLRNLSTVSPEICDNLMEQDIMTSLSYYFNQYLENWYPDPTSKSNEEEIDTVVQSVHLLLNLCESSELALKYLGESKVLDILLKLLNITTFGTDIVIAVLQCLFVVVEDNPVAIEKVKSNAENQLQDLLSIEGMDPVFLLIKTLAAGVIVNTCGNIVTLPLNIINLIMHILSNALSVDHRVVCNQVSSDVPLLDSNGKITTPKGKEAIALEKQLKAVSQVLDAQQTSVEIVANICSCEDNDDAMNEDSSDSEELDDEDMTDDGAETTFTEDKLPPEVLEALVSFEIFTKVWARTELPAENVLLILKEYDGSKHIVKKLHTLQSGALLCINNMISTLPIENLGGVNGVYKIWVETGKLVFKQNFENLVLIESATAVMRAALDKIKYRENGNTTNQNLFNDLSLSDIEMMLNGIKECQMPEIRSNLIRMIGILGLLLTNNLNETTSNVVCVVTEFLLEQAHKENEVWVMAEALDTLVDLYSEDETDLIAAKVNLVDKLTALSPVFKIKSRQQKGLPKEYKVLVSTVSSNLPRFIKYKKSRISKLKV